MKGFFIDDEGISFSLLFKVLIKIKHTFKLF